MLANDQAARHTIVDAGHTEEPIAVGAPCEITYGTHLVAFIVPLPRRSADFGQHQLAPAAPLRRNDGRKCARIRSQRIDGLRLPVPRLSFFLMAQ